MLERPGDKPQPREDRLAELWGRYDDSVKGVSS